MRQIPQSDNAQSDGAASALILLADRPLCPLIADQPDGGQVAAPPPASTARPIARRGGHPRFRARASSSPPACALYRFAGSFRAANLEARTLGGGAGR